MTLSAAYVIEQLRLVKQQQAFNNKFSHLAYMNDWLEQKRQFLTNTMRCQNFESQESQAFWVTLNKFQNYRNQYVVRQLNKTSLNVYRLTLQQHHRKLLQIYAAAMFDQSNIKYSRKQPKNALFSILTIPTGTFLISPLMLANPTNRSIVKIIIPIQEKESELIFKFSNVMALKIIYATGVDIVAEEAFTLLYGQGTQIVSVPGTFKRYLIMPIFPGESLESFYRYHVGPILRAEVDSLTLNLYQLISIMQAIALEVQCIHRAGWVHHDIKPNNILVEQFTSAAVKVRIIDADDMRKIKTPLRHRLGTEEYMAPEMIKFVAGESANYSADIFSLARTFICLVTSGVKETAVNFSENSNPEYSWEQSLLSNAVYVEEHYSLILWEKWCDQYLKLPIPPIIKRQHETILAMCTALFKEMFERSVPKRCNIECVVARLHAVKALLASEQPQFANGHLPDNVASDDLSFPYAKTALRTIVAVSDGEGPGTPLLNKPTAIKDNGCVIL